FVAVAMIFLTHRLPAYAGGSTAAPLSIEALRAAVRDIVRDSPAIRLGRLIRSSSDARIWINPTPLSPKRVMKLAPSFWQTLWSTGAGRELLGLFEEEIRAAVAEFDGTLILQPDETRVDSIFTDDRYLVGSVRLTADLAAPQPDNDVWHMNAAYGSKILDR